jgi:hypothetical protein
MLIENDEQFIQSYSKGQKGFSNSKQILIGLPFFSTGKNISFQIAFLFWENGWNTFVKSFMLEQNVIALGKTITDYINPMITLNV